MLINTAAASPTGSGQTILIERMIAVLMLFVNQMPPVVAEPFQYPFMQRALLTAILVGGTCGVLSCYVILKRWSLLGDAVSHAVLPGVALSYLLGWPLLLGAFLTGALTSLGIGLIERSSRLKEDAAMGIMFTGSFALGIVMISRMATSTHIMHILFGSVLGVQPEGLLVTLASSLLTISVLLVYYKQFHLYSFDPVQAHSLGMNTTALYYGLLLLLTLTIVTSLETVGIILVVAMLITPGATASFLTRSLATMMLTAAGCGIFAAVVGLYLSFILNVASGGTMVLTATLLFGVVFLFAPQQGVISSALRARKRQT